jgi:YHS domain-containing protein
MVVDPVCKMSIEPATAAASLDHEGTTHFFCSTACRDSFAADPATYLVRVSNAGPSCHGHGGHAAAARPGVGAIAIAAAWGLGGMAGLFAVYFGLLILVSGWAFTLDQFQQFRPFIVALAVGFGAQVGLFTYLRRAVHAAQSGRVMAVTGTTSGAAMVSCCAHYLVNLLPALGATGLVSLVGQYQVELFWVGLASNLAGLAYMSYRLAAFLRDVGAVPPQVPHAAGLAIVILAAALMAAPAIAADPLTTQVNREGQVTVTVTPLATRAGTPWRFRVVLETHSVDLGQDLRQVAALAGADGGDLPPLSWEGNPGGGHHREGILTFASPSPLPASVILKIRGIGPVPERIFSWPVPTAAQR